ncbi:MAG: hypothetical protein J6P82_09885, partial [Bacteroidales bacterium]|nr:hypothetical protein [Bacteroidales bacterium]
MNKNIWTPLWVSLLLVLGILSGLDVDGSNKSSKQVRSAYVPVSSGFDSADDDLSTGDASAKMLYLFDLLKDRYVDTLNLSKLVEDAIPVIIEELDPH